MRTKEKETNEKNSRASMYRDWKLAVRVVYSFSDALTYVVKVIVPKRNVYSIQNFLAPSVGRRLYSFDRKSDFPT